MIANQAGSRLIHRVMVERIGKMPGIARPDWRAPRVVPDPILIDTTCGVAARIEGVRGLFNPCDGNIRGKKGIEATLETREIHRFGGVECHYLAQSMDARIGAPGNAHPHGFAEQALERGLNRALHGGHGGLYLPAVVIRPVVFECQLERQSGAKGHGKQTTVASRRQGGLRVSLLYSRTSLLLPASWSSVR